MGIAAALWSASVIPASAMAPIMPVAEVQRGMSGQAYTVLDDTGVIQSFPVDIVGVVDNGKGSSRMIMAKTDGPLIRSVGGILQGMSGSPVYVDGQLVGAVAAGIKEMTPYTFFITPIEDMEELWKLPDNKNKTRIRNVNLKKYAADREKLKEELDKEEKEKSARGELKNEDQQAPQKNEKEPADVKDDAEAKTDADTEKAADVDAEKPAEENADVKTAADTAKTADAKDGDAKVEVSNKADVTKEEPAEPKPETDVKETVDIKDKADVKADAENADTKEAVDVKPDADTDKGTVNADKTAAEPVKQEPSEAEKPAEPADADMTKAEPKDALFVSGFNAAGLRYLQERISPLGFDILPFGAPSTVSRTQTKYDATLEPGSPVGVAVAYGDFAVGATGTVTAVDGKRVLAFGHPFLHKGNVNYFMTDASVVGTISGMSNGMKVANIGNLIGRVNQDRESGIAGILGTFPSVVPIRVSVQDKTLARRDDYGARIAYDEDFLPQLSGGIAYAAMSKTSDTLGGSTANVHFTIRTNATDSGKVERSNMFYNTADVGQIAVAELTQAMDIICANTDRESDIIDVQVDVTVDNDRKTASIVSAIPDRETVKPGDTVMFTTTIKPYRRDKETLLIPFRVPKTQPEGPMALDVRGGGLVPVTAIMLMQQSGVDITADTDTKTRTTQEQLEDLQQSGQNNEIIIAPGPAANAMTSEKETKKMMRRYQEQQEAAAKEQAKPHKVDLISGLQPKKKRKFTTPYIIDNVIHTTLQVER